MGKTSEFTSFTKDIQGRYRCNDIFEADAWKREGGRPFDIVVIGGGTFGAVIAEHLWYRQRQMGGGLRTLVVARQWRRRPARGRCGRDSSRRRSCARCRRPPRRAKPSTAQDPRFIGLQTHTGRLLFRHIQWKAL